MGYRRLIVPVVLTAVLAALAQPLYSVGGIWTGIINSRNNKTVRLDLLKTGGKDNRLTFSKMSMLRFSSDRCPAGTEKSGCYAIEGGLKSKWRAYELTAQAAADGEVKIVLKSPGQGRPDYANRFPRPENQRPGDVPRGTGIFRHAPLRIYDENKKR